MRTGRGREGARTRGGAALNWNALVNPYLVGQALASGLLMGLVYALSAVGLSLIFGVMDVVNFAHGEFLMLGMYVAFWLWAWYAVDPTFSAPAAAGALFLLGLLVYAGLVRRLLKGPPLAQIVGTFGLAVFLRGAAQFLFGTDHRTITSSLVGGSLILPGSIVLPWTQIVAAAGALVATGLVYWLVNRTELGWALMATAQNRDAAALMGIDTGRMYALAWGIGAACVGVAGGLLALRYPIFPEVGLTFGLIAFVVVALGGFGSISGAFLAGIIIGVVELLAGNVNAAFKLAVVFALYLVIMLVRPQGLRGQA